MNDILLLRNTFPFLFPAMSAIAGALIGSFLGVVIERVPAALLREGYVGDTLLFPPSHCPQCQHRLAGWENIPIVSWLLLRGQCRACGMKIPPALLALELLCALFFALCSGFAPSWSDAAALCVLWCSLLSLSLIDLRHTLLPDCITQPLLWAGLIWHLFGSHVPLTEALWGAVGGYLSLWLLYWSFRLATGREGLGYGDFKLLAALGAWLGWQALPVLLLSAALFAIAFFVLFRRMLHEKQIPFGPALSISAMAIAVLKVSHFAL